MTQILVIEDETDLRNVIKEYLEKAEYEVGVASDGEEGVRLFTENPYDVVITDILMPNKEGLETILEISQESQDVKIIAISGGGTGLGDELLDMVRDLGAHRVLRKPIPMSQLVEVIQDVLNDGG